MRRPHWNRLEPLANVAGLGAWAGSQMLLVVTLASAVSLDLVGVFSLGLAVNSLLMVALGLNLRLAIAVDGENRIPPLAALTIRFASALAVFAVAAATMYVYAPDERAFVLGALLLSGRIADQLADIFYGYQQQLGRSVFVSASFFARGGMTGLICIALFLGRDHAGLVIAAGSLLYVAATLLMELAWFRADWRLEPGRRLPAAIGEALRHENVRGFSTFPLFDALHFSSFRLAVAPVLDARAFGVFALAMNAFSAVQVVITALGLTSLSRLKSGAHERAADPVRSMLRESALLGGACLAVFALCSLGFALLGAFEAIDTELLGLFLAGNFVALMPFPFMAFVSQGSIFFGNRSGYWQAPLVGALAFGLVAAALAVAGRLTPWQPLTSYFALCAALLVSCALRIGVSLQHLGAPRSANA